MSNKNKYEVVCPHCSEKQNVIVWLSLNATIDPKAKEGLINNRINLFNCENCGDEIRILTELLYQDMQKQFCIQYVPMEIILQENQTFRFNKYGFFQMVLILTNILR